MHDVAQVLEQPHPLCVVGKDSSVEHVRIRQDDVPSLTDCFSGIAWSIPVAGEYSETVVEPVRQVLQFSQLVLGKRFGREQI